jgi:hypothetical protein
MFLEQVIVSGRVVSAGQMVNSESTWHKQASGHAVLSLTIVEWGQLASCSNGHVCKHVTSDSAEHWRLPISWEPALVYSLQPETARHQYRLLAKASGFVLRDLFPPWRISRDAFTNAMAVPSPQPNSVNILIENRNYGHRGSSALTMRHPSIRKSWH